MRRPRLGITIEAQVIVTVPFSSFSDESDDMFADDLGLTGWSMSPEQFLSTLEEALIAGVITPQQVEDVLADYHSRTSN